MEPPQYRLCRKLDFYRNGLEKAPMTEELRLDLQTLVTDCKNLEKTIVATPENWRSAEDAAEKLPGVIRKLEEKLQTTSGQVSFKDLPQISPPVSIPGRKVQVTLDDTGS